ncbi:multiple inositol polyphosphate phosphatase 1-like [Argopecten irradians]|uniref:multiple inositol polyphosphate phosphatase 1-like n=1 Tax=Argopecten irradians TaxID=31199 RepID=UPI0037234DCF
MSSVVKGYARKRKLLYAFVSIPCRPLASFRFGHSGSVSSVYTALGLFDGSNTFLASDYQANAGRLYRSSAVLPFSANLVTIMYKCDIDYWVKMMVNEKEMTIPACGDVMCPYTAFMEHYKQFVNCDFNQICGNSDVNSGAVPEPMGFIMTYSMLLILTLL